MQVAANTEEQTAATQSFTGGISNLSVEADFIATNCDNTGRAIFDISKKINAIRVEMVKNSFSMSDADMIEIYKTDHMHWRWKVYNMLLGYDKVDIQAIGDYKNCRLGKWYYGIDCSNISESKVFKDLEKPHIELHDIAKEAVFAYEHGDIKKAESCLVQMDECSKTVMTYLDQIKTLL
jgi:methyl-accepting chemotaxis protein